MLYIYDVIVIGAGPAGLMAGSIFKDRGLQYLILEKGSPLVERTLDNPKDIISGVGGGGLFSDGKLSLPPSASNLWRGLPAAEIKEAYDLLGRKLEKLEISIPKWKNAWEDSFICKDEHKKYDSVLLNEFARFRLANYLSDKNIDRVHSNEEVIEIDAIKDYYEVKTGNSRYFARRILIAAGKFGNNLLDSLKDQATGKIFEKYELGVRIEVPDIKFKPNTEECVDYKVIRQIEEGVELRTFCSCKDGAVLQSKFSRFITFNGSKMPHLTHRSNIGIVLRAEKNDSIYMTEIKKWLKKYIEPFKIPLKEYVCGNVGIYGKTVDGLLQSGIKNIVDIEKISDGDCVYGPEIEYAGEYVDLLSKRLELMKNVWVAGDLTGSFRGLTAALISGIYCAKSICSAIDKDIDRSIQRLGIKVSSFEKMDMVFTAQSKNFFYCKDVICEFVLKRGKLPINPFMVFGYFLNDRVDRSVIRQGNNQLIQFSDELWVFGPIADGVLFEIALAKKRGKPIKFFKLGTRVNEITEIMVDEVTFEPEVHARQIKKNDLTAFIKDQNSDDGQLDFLNLLTEDDDE